MSPKLYFGHPVNTFHAEIERHLLDVIAKAFPAWRIENPNHPTHLDGYKRRLAADGNGMRYFFEEVLPLCGAGVFLPFRDGMFGAGVYGEAVCLHRLGKPIHEISVSGVIAAMTFDDARALTIPQTIARIRDDSGPLPY